MDDRIKLNLYRGIESGSFTDAQKLKAYRAIESNAPNEEVADLAASLSFSNLGSGKTLKELVDIRQGRDRENFDYTTGADGRLRSLLSFAETDGDREAILESLVGSDGFVKDKAGRYSLTKKGQEKRGMEPIGKNLVIEDEGFSMRDFSDLAGIVPETVGSVAGAIIGGGPSFGLGAVAGAGIGGALGQALEESIEGLLGVQTQGLGDIAKDVAIEGVIGASGELIGAAVIGAGRKVIGGGKSVAGRLSGVGALEEVNKENLTVARRLIDKDFTPSLQSLGAERLGYGQKFLENAGKVVDRRERNLGLALAEKNKFLEGVRADAKGQLADDVMFLSENQFVKFQKLQESANQAYLRAIDGSVDVLSKSMKNNVDLNPEILGRITNTFSKFGADAADNFSAIDEILAPIAGGRGNKFKLFNVRPLESKIMEYNAEMRNLADPLATDIDIFLRSTQGKASFSEMAVLRKAINDNLYFNGKISTKAALLLEDIKGNIDNVLMSKNIGDHIPEDALSMIDKTSLIQAAKQREIAIKHYRDGIEPFEKLVDLSIIRSLRDLQSLNGNVPRATSDKLFSKVVKPDEPERLRNILKAVDNPNEVRDMLGRSFIDDALTDAGRDPLDPTQFNGKTFRNKIMSLKGTGKELFGDKWDEIQNLANAIGKSDIRGGVKAEQIRLASEAGAPTSVLDALNDIAKVTSDYDDLLKARVLKDLETGKLGPRSYDEVVQALTTPNLSQSEASRIMEFFGDNPQMKSNMRQVVLQDIMESVDSGLFDNAKNAGKLQETLGMYDRKVLSKILDDTANPNTTKALYEFAEELSFLGDVTKEGAIAAGSIWAQVFKHPLTAFARVQQMRLGAKALGRHEVAKKFLELREGGGTAKENGRAILGFLDDAAREQGVNAGATASKIGKVVQGTGRALGGASRVAKQVTPRALGLGSQNSKSRTSVPVVTPPAMNFEPPAPRKTGPAAPLSPIEQIRRNAQQMTLRERAAQNPAVAATLLGGLGSAGLL